MIRWTSKMKDELLKTEKLIDFSKKYNISYNTVRLKYFELGGERKREIKKKDKEIKLSNSLSEITKVIKNIDVFLEKGYNYYLTEVKNKVAKSDKEISDYRHLLELSYDEMDQEQLASISTNIGVISRERRLFKTECEFLLAYKKEAQDFIIFMNKIMQTSEKIDNKLYSTRVLKEEDKKYVLVTSENNNKLKKLEEENKKLKDEKNILAKELCNLEFYNVDNTNIKLDNNWKNLFNKLDKTKKQELINKAELKYSGVNIKEIKDKVVFEKYLPEVLIESKLFLSKKNI